MNKAAGHILLFTLLAFAVVWLALAFLPNAEAAIEITPLLSSASIPKGRSQSFDISVSSSVVDYTGQTLTINITNISPTRTGINYNTPTKTPSGGSFSGQVTLTIGTFSTTTPQTYTITIVAYACGSPCTSPEYSTPSQTLTLNVGDFGVTVSPATIEVRQQSSQTATITVNSIANFQTGSSPISLTWVWVTSPPLDATFNVNPNTITLSAGGSVFSTFTFTAQTTTPIGTYVGNVTGIFSDGSTTIRHDFRVTIVVKSLPTLEISITASPNPAVVSKLTTITIRVNSDGAPVQAATLAISSTTGILSLTSGITDSSGQFLVTFNSTTPGQASISVTATKTGYITGTSTLVLNVVGNFVVSVVPSNLTMTLDSTRTVQIAVQSTEGFNSAVVLSLPTLPVGMFVSINPSVVTPPPNGIVTATLTIRLNMTAVPGSLDLTITATRSPLIKSAILRLNVPVRDFQIIIKPETLVIAQGKEGFFNISILSRGGFSGTVDIRSTGIPPDIEFSIVPNSFSLETGATRNALLSVRASEVSRAGNFLFLVEATSGGIRRSAQAVLVILPLISVTVDSLPRVASLIVDGALVQPGDLPKQFRWVQGETHAISVPNQIVNGTPGTRYVFTRWSDGTTSQARLVTITAQATYRVEFKTQFFLTIKSTLPVPTIPSTGAGWFDNNTQASISTPQIVNIAANRRYDFRVWTGNITDSKTNTTVLMNGPKTATSTYTLQFFINAVTEPKGLAEITNGNKWHDLDATVEFSTTKRVRDYSFRFWTVDNSRITGLPVSVRIDRPFNLTANYVFLPKVSIVWANTTVSKTEFQGESAYLWLKISNTEDRAGQVRLDASSSFDGISVNPKSLVLNFEPGQSYVLAFELKFLKDGTGTFEAKINETAGSPDSASVPMKIFPIRSRDNLRAIAKAISVENLAVLNDLMTPSAEVKSLAENILAVANIRQNAGPVDKVKALLAFVVQHYEAAPNTRTQSAIQMATELQARGGALTVQKISGDSRTISILYGGLLRSLDIPVRPLIGAMEMSPMQEAPYLMLHTWIEFRVDREWIFVDPTEGLIELSAATYPANLQNLAKDPKMYYELSPKWAGTIQVVAYEGRAIDVTERYKATTYPTLDGFAVYTRGDTSIIMRTNAGADFASGFPFAAVWTPVDPQAPEIRALKPEGQIILVSSSTPISQYPIFVNGPRRTDYTFSTMEVSAIFPVIDSMAGSFIDRGTIEHTVKVRSDGRLQTGQVEHIGYSDKSITVTSNSTLISALSSIDIKAVKLTLIGREGTTGILNITVPSNLLVDDLRSSSGKIIVLLDGKFAKPEFNNLGDRMVISMSYGHSTRNIVAYLKTFDVSFDIKDPYSLPILDAELTMVAPTHTEIKESDNSIYKNLIPGKYQFTIKYRGEQHTLNPEITDSDIRFTINLVRSDATIAGFALGIIVAIAVISIITQLLLSKVFQRKTIS
ncbi:MAG: hypothetical protein FJ358_03430 [Thaumarchaeota archaeon]|nr:hypothetical protein [Nitrososphaerota archaeon]